MNETSPGQENRGRHRVSTAGQSPREIGDTKEIVSEPQDHASRLWSPGRRRIVRNPGEEIDKSAESLSIYKRRFTETVKDLVGQGKLAQVFGDRIPMQSSVPILVDITRQTHNTDLKNGGIFIHPSYTELHLDHEMTHIPLLPGIAWEPLEEGHVQARAELINTHIQHPDHGVKGKFYSPHVQLDYEIRRLTGLSPNDMDDIFSQPAKDYTDLTEIKRMANEDPERIESAKEANLAVINRRTTITVNNKPMGIIDYAKILELKAKGELRQKGRLVDQMSAQEAKEIDEAIVAKVVEGLQRFRSPYPTQDDRRRHSFAALKAYAGRMGRQDSLRDLVLETEEMIVARKKAQQEEARIQTEKARAEMRILKLDKDSPDYINSDVALDEYHSNMPVFCMFSVEGSDEIWGVFRNQKEVTGGNHHRQPKYAVSVAPLVKDTDPRRKPGALIFDLTTEKILIGEDNDITVSCDTNKGKSYPVRLAINTLGNLVIENDGKTTLRVHANPDSMK